MKKFVFILSILAFTMAISLTAFGADALYRMLHGDEVESFKKDQDAIILGQITGRDENRLRMKVIKVLSGKVNKENIQVEDSFIFFGPNKTENQPQVHDFCVLSLKRYGDVYKRAWYTLKADSGDYMTLKLENQIQSGDVAAIEYFVNSGGTEREFSFESNSVYAKGRLIYSSEGNKKDVETTKADNSFQKDHNIQKTDDKKNQELERDGFFKITNPRNLLGLALVLAVLGVLSAIMVKLRKKP